MMKKLLLTTPLLMPCLMAHAQADVTDSTEIVVQESRLQMSVTEQNRDVKIITAAQIARLPVRSVNELLAYATGVDVRQRGPWGGQADISIDGGTFDETLVLLNGVRITDPQTGHNMMNLPVSLTDIDRIEVLRGAAARIYGINALTGAINIVTRSAKTNAVTAEAYTGSSFRKNETTGNPYQNFGGHATLTGTHGNYSHLLSGGIDKGNGYRYNTANTIDKIYYQGKLKGNEGNDLNFWAGYTYNTFGANGYYAAPGDSNSHENVRSLLSAMDYHYKVSRVWTIRPRVSYQHKADDYRYIAEPVVIGRNLHKTDIYEAAVNNTFETEAGQFGLGIEGRNERLNSTNLGQHSRYNYGLSGEYKGRFGGNLLLTAGAYLNYNTDWGWQLFPGIDLGYNITRKLKIYANAGTAQRLPTYTDLYYEQANLIIGNPALKPERSFSYEGGLKYNDGHWDLKGSVFHRQISDFIDWVKQQANDAWQPQNFSKVNIGGLSGDAVYQTAWQGFFRNIRAEAAYTYLDPHISKTPDQQQDISRYAINSLKDQLLTSLQIIWSGGWSLSVTGRYQKRVSYTDYFLLDSRLQWQYRNFMAYLDGTNLTGKTFVEAGAMPLPGRWVTIGARFVLQ